MTPQEIFDFTVRSLHAQGASSTRFSSHGPAKVCAYRGSNGRKCAVGFHIPDDKYNIELEILGLSKVLSIIGLSEHEDLLQSLQRCHDDAHVVTFGGHTFLYGLEPRLRNTAARFKLSPAAIDELWATTPIDAARPSV